MRNRLLAAALAAALLSLAPIAARAGPISGYPAAATPLNGSETAIGTQSGATVQITTQSIANIVTAATNSWTGVQTFPAPGASHGSIVLTPGTISGTPPNGSLWTTSTGVFAEIGGTTVSLAVGNAVTQFGSVISGDCAEWITTGVIADVGTPCGSGGGGGGGSPGGANSTLQFNNLGAFGGATGFIYTLSGTKLTGPDGSVWGPTSFKVGTGSAVDLNSNPIVSGSAPALFVPACEGATWLIGPGTNYCSHATTGGTDNIGIGTIVFDHLTTGFGNVAMGSENNHLLTTGSDNTSIGFEAGHILTTGSDNVAVGNNFASETTGSFNVAIGQGALNNQAGGSSNVGVGPSAGATLLTGATNVCVGANSCPTETTGNKNISIGFSGGYGIATGHGNVWLGGHGTTLADQNDSVTLADGDGTVLEQFLTASGFDLFNQPLEIPFFASSNPLNGSGFSLGSPTVVGTSATVACTTSHVCDSISGEVTLTTGTSVSADGLALTISFVSRTNKPNCMVTSFKAASGTDIADNWSETVGGVAISSNANLASSTAYTIRYICGGI